MGASEALAAGVPKIVSGTAGGPALQRALAGARPVIDNSRRP